MAGGSSLACAKAIKSPCRRSCLPATATFSRAPQVCAYAWAVLCQGAGGATVANVTKSGENFILTTGASGADINASPASCNATLYYAYTAVGTSYSDASDAPLQFTVRCSRT